MRAALIIGCGVFDDPEIASLRFASQDANRFAHITDRVFGVQPENLHVLADGASGHSSIPTRAGLLRALTVGKRNLGQRRIQTLFFYFSGHGFHSIQENQDYIVLKDTVLSAIGDTALSFATLLKYIRGWEADHTVLFLDACRSHLEAHKSLSGFESPPVDVSALCPPGMITFCSCSPGEKSYEADECQSGLFTEALIQSVSSEARCATVYEIDKFLVRTLPEMGIRYARPIQNPFTKVEPLSTQNLVLARDEVMHEWQGTAPFGKELRPEKNESARLPDVSRLMGIDFGTVNSIATLFSPQTGPIILPSPDGEMLVPSVVNFRPDLSYVVGKRAVSQLRDDPAGTVGYVKRALGGIGATSIYGRSIFPVDVATLIIKSLKHSAEEVAGFTFTDVLASIPINFSTQQEGGLTQALRHAGFSSIRFIPEPCAAALVAADAQFKSDIAVDTLRVLVVDLGGGTLDIAAIEIDRGGDTGIVLDTIDVEGDPELGGMDYDLAVARCIREELALSDVPFERIERTALMAEAERAKIILNQRDSATVVFDNLEIEGSEPREVVAVLTRDRVSKEFRELNDRVVKRIRSLLTRSGRLARDLETRGMDWPQVIVLAGQGTKLFSLRDSIKNLFPDRSIFDRYQDSAVARGLGLYLRTLTHGVSVSRPMLLLNVYGKSMGLKYALNRTVSPVGRKDSNCIEIAPNRTGNTFRCLIIDSETTIPTKKLREVAFEESMPTMEIMPIEVFNAGQESPLGTVVIERLTEDVTSLDIVVDISADFTVVLEINSASKVPSGRDRIFCFQINNYHALPIGFELASEGETSSNDVRCVESTFRRLRERSKS
jgi:molecular chaperone DnaK (HSP70)